MKEKERGKNETEKITYQVEKKEKVVITYQVEK